MIGSDVHGCYMDPKAYGCFLAVASQGWDQVILNGDVVDFSQISSHVRKVGGFQREFRDDVSLIEEIHWIRTQILAPLRKAVGPKTPILMRLGNHETRFLSIAENNPTALAELLKAMRKLRSLYLEEVLDLDRYGVKLSYNAVDVLCGTFSIIHGVKSSQGVAKSNLLRYGSGTSGHSHRSNSFTQVMHGKLQGWWESGCMRTVKDVEYLPHGDRPDWSQAFLTLTIHRKTGDFFCKPHFVINGKTEFNGQIITA